MKEYSRQGEREVILERKQAILLFTGGVIALVLVFILGSLFGKNLAEKKLAREKAKGAEQAIAPTAPEINMGTTVKPLPASTTMQIAKAPSEEGAKIMEKIKEQQPPPQITSTEKTPIAKPQTTTAPSTGTIPETKPSQPAQNFAIQVAAFPDKTSADELLKKLRGNKWDAYSIPIEIPGKGTYHRVYVGKYETKAQAEKALLIFKSKEPDHKDAFIRKLE